ncbi:Ydr279p protein family-domain-containing protein [Chaetomium fimeti]|uniref:Ribonuclease H2 subunit B n=1 Tax=Chaetomium fimeti TaxID=1854472 RepID=A0AAE0H9Y0_9PEZI|nr:Ydr279p protein family-domain-containing protein [Chaetomium fimeti]
MARTRAKGAATAASKDDKKSATTATKSSTSIYTLSTESDNPPKLFILPKSASPAARIVTLQHPRHNKPTRFLVCPEAGFFEFTTVSPPKSTPRSWLVQSTTPNQDHGNNQSTQITQSPALHLATPYDPLFLLLPALYNNTTTTTTDAQQEQEQEEPPHQQNQKRMFLSLEDHLDNTPDPSRHLAELLATSSSTRQLVEARLAAVCGAVQAGDERMYRVDEAKLLGALLAKARAVVGGGAGRLPESMEERFVRKELEAPVLGVRVARGSGAVVVVEGEGAAAVRSNDFSRKRGGDEEQDERAEKRRKQEAEEKAKKANMSRGVKNLMKVNTSGMKKMSDFFKKKA